MASNGGVLQRPVRVLVVDDTRTVRMLIRALASRDPNIQVVGEAADAIEAGEKLRELNPDVMTLDVEMPKMNGLVFLEKVLNHRPLPVIMISSHTTENSDAAVKALALGAFECFDVRRLRPSDPAADRLTEVIIAAAQSRARSAVPPPPSRSQQPSDFRWNGKTVLIGSSTGGVETLIRILSDFPASGPPVVIAQHMPPHFLESFAMRLDNHCAPRVALARPGDRLEPGTIWLGPGGEEHVALDPRDANKLISTPKTASDLYSPSVEVLFQSGAPFGSKVVAVMLTGMGRDGATGMLAIRNAGGHTIAQSGDTAVVDGMPRSAREIGAAVEVVPLPNIAAHILGACGHSLRTAS